MKKPSSGRSRSLRRYPSVWPCYDYIPLTSTPDLPTEITFTSHNTTQETTTTTSKTKEYRRKSLAFAMSDIDDKTAFTVRDSVISTSSAESSSSYNATTMPPTSDCHACSCNAPFVLVSSPPKAGGPEMRSALLTLGCGPTMHTHELIQRDTNFSHAWKQALQDPGAVDWVNFLSDYDSGCGEPLHSVAGDVIRSFGRAKQERKLNPSNTSGSSSKKCRKRDCEGYRRLKVIIMTRETEEWFKAVSDSGVDLFASKSKSYKKLKFFSTLVPGRKQRMLLDILNRSTTPPPSQNPNESKFHSEYITQHRLELQRIARESGLDEEDVLVYDISQGWEPLTTFLGTNDSEKPRHEFPGAATIWAEEAEDYKRIKKRMKIKAAIWSVLWLLVLGAGIALIVRLGV